MTQQNDNSGALFKAEKKTDKHPEYTGSAIIHGQQYWISAWIKKSRDGTKTFMSLAFKPKDAQSGKQKNATDQVYAPQETEEDEIPFALILPLLTSLFALLGSGVIA